MRAEALRQGSSGPIPISRTITSSIGPLTRLKKGSPTVTVSPRNASASTG